MDMDLIQQVPRDIQIEILKNINPHEILRLCEVNSYWKNICKDNNLWEYISNNLFGNSDMKGNNWFETYQHYYFGINNNIGELINRYYYIDPRYGNIKNIHDDLFEWISDFIRTYNNNEYVDEPIFAQEKQYIAYSESDNIKKFDEYLPPGNILTKKIIPVIRPISKEAEEDLDIDSREFLIQERISDYIKSFLQRLLNIPKSQIRRAITIKDVPQRYLI